MTNKKWESLFENEFLSKLGDDWPPSTAATRTAVFGLVEKWLGEDKVAIAELLKTTLADGRLSKDDGIAIITALISTWSSKSPFGSNFTQQLFDALKDGDLTVNEIAAAAAGWIASRSKNKNVQFFIKEIADGKLSREDVKALLLKFIEDHKDKDASKAVEDLLTGKVLLSELLLLVAAFHLATTPADPGSTTEQLLQTMQGYLQNTQFTGLDTALDKLKAKDVTGLAATAIATAVKNDDLPQLLKKELAEKLRARLKDALGKLLLEKVEGLKDTQVEALSKAISDLLSGKRSLFSEKTDLQEFTDLHYPPEMFDVWVRIRKVLYAAKWAVTNSPVVSSDALARPHVFAAAAIKPDTVLNTMVTVAEGKLFQDCVKQFCAAEFAGMPNAEALQNPNNYPVTTDRILKGATAGSVLWKVWIFLYP